MLLYLEERYEEVDNKMANFDSFPNEIQAVLAEYHTIFNSKLRKLINVELDVLNEWCSPAHFVKNHGGFFIPQFLPDSGPRSSVSYRGGDQTAARPGVLLLGNFRCPFNIFSDRSLGEVPAQNDLHGEPWCFFVCFVFTGYRKQTKFRLIV